MMNRKISEETGDAASPKVPSAVCNVAVWVLVADGELDVPMFQTLML
jgi:hypothetical protein